MERYAQTVRIFLHDAGGIVAEAEVDGDGQQIISLLRIFLIQVKRISKQHRILSAGQPNGDFVSRADHGKAFIRSAQRA